jgi:hypothetical protein
MTETEELEAEISRLKQELAERKDTAKKILNMTVLELIKLLAVKLFAAWSRRK